MFNPSIPSVLLSLLSAAPVVGDEAVQFSPITYLVQSSSMVHGILGALLPYGAALAIIMIGLDLTRRYLFEGALEIADTFRHILAAALILFVLVPVSSDSNKITMDPGSYPYEFFFRDAVLKPFNSVNASIKESAKATNIKQGAEFMNKLGKNWHDNKLGGVLYAVMGAILASLSGILMLFAWIVCWAMSYYVDIMFVLIYSIGPIFIPFMLFRPMSGIAWAWLKTLISFPIMGIFGNVLYSMICTSNLFTKMADGAGAADYFNTIPYAIVIILSMIMVPSIVSGLMGSVAPSAIAAGRTLITAGKAGVGAAMGASAATSIASGNILKSSGESKMAKAVASGNSSGMARAQASINAGTASQLRGMDIMRQHFPSVANALDIQHGQHQYARTMSSLSAKQQQDSMVQHASKLYGADVANKLATAFNDNGGVAGSLQFGDKTEYGLTKAVNNNLSRFGIEHSPMARSLNEASRMASSPLNDAQAKEKIGQFAFDQNTVTGNQDLILENAYRRYGAKAADELAAKIQGTDFSIQAPSKDFGETIERNTTRAFHENGMTIPPPLTSDSKGDAASSIADLTRYNNGRDFDFTINSPENNRAIMAEYVEKRFGSNESKAFLEYAERDSLNIQNESGGVKAIHETVKDYYQTNAVNYGKFTSSVPDHEGNNTLSAKSDQSGNNSNQMYNQSYAGNDSYQAKRNERYKNQQLLKEEGNVVMPKSQDEPRTPQQQHYHDLWEKAYGRPYYTTD